MKVHLSHCLFMRAVLDGPVIAVLFLLLLILVESFSDVVDTPFETVILLKYIVLIT